MGRRRWEPAETPPLTTGARKQTALPRSVRWRPEGRVARSARVRERVAVRLQDRGNDGLPDLGDVHRRVAVEPAELLELPLDLVGREHGAERGAGAVERALAALHAEEPAERVAQRRRVIRLQRAAEDRIHGVDLDRAVGERREHLLPLLERGSERRRPFRGEEELALR